MATAGSIVVDLLARTGSFETDMDRAARKLKGVGQEVDTLSRNINRLMVASGAALAAFAGTSAALAMQMAKGMDATAKMAEQIGTTTEALTGLRFAAQQYANVSDQTFDMAMRRMTRRIEEAANGAGGAKNALEALGLSAQQLSRLSPDKQFLALADALKNTDSQAARLRHTMAIFDTEGMPLVAALQRGSAEMERGIETARRYGLVLSQDAAQAAQQFVSNMDALSFAARGFQQALAEAVLPYLVEATNKLVEFSEKAGPAAERVEQAFKIAGVGAGALALVLGGRLVASATAVSASFVRATYDTVRYEYALARMAEQTRIASAGFATLAATSRGWSIISGILGGPGGMVATIGLAAAGFVAMAAASRDAGEGLISVADSAEEAIKKFRELGVLQRQEELTRLGNAHAEQARAASKAWTDFIDQLEPTTARGARAVAQMRAEMREEVEAIRRNTSMSSRDMQQAISDLIDTWVESGRITAEQATAYRAAAAGAEKLQATANQTEQRMSTLSEEAARLEAALRGAAGGAQTLNEALSQTNEAGQKFLERLADQAITAGLKTQREQLEALVKAGKLVFSPDDLEKARKHADHIDRMNAAYKGASSAAKEFESSVKSLIAAHLPEVKATEDLHKSLATLQAAQRAGIIVGQNYTKALESINLAYAKQVNDLLPESIKKAQEQVKAARDQQRQLQQQIRTFGMAESAVLALAAADTDSAIAKLEAAKANEIANGATTERIKHIEAEIQVLRELRDLQLGSAGLQGQLEWREQQRQQWEDWSRDVEQIFDRVGQSLTDAIFDGGKSGKELLKDIFKSLTFNVVINPIMNQLQGWVTNQLGGLFGAQNPQQGGGGFGLGGTTFGAGAVEMAGDWLLRSGIAPETGANMLMNADSIAGTASSILGYGKAIFDLAEGRYGAGIGAAIGTYILPGPGTVVGNILGGLIDDIFGDDKPDTRHAQMSHADLQADGRFVVTTWDDRQSREVQEAAAAYATEAVKGATELFDKIGIDAAFTRFTTLMESSILGDKQGVGSSATIRIGDLEHEIGLAIESSWTKHGYGGWSEADMFPRLMTDVQLTILEAFQAAGDQLPSVLSGMLEGIDIRALGAEQAQALAQQFSAVVEQVSAFQSALEQLPFASLRDLTFDVSATIISALGGIESANAALSSYFDNFYSQEEKLDWLSQQISGSLAAVGLAMPDVTQGADAAKQAFRELFESIDPLAPGGAEAAAAMLAVNGQFAELVAGMDQLAEASRRAAEQARQQALSDLSTAYNAVVQAGQREIARLQESFGATDSALSAYRSAVQRLESEFNSLFSAIDRGIQALRGTGAAFDAQYHQARAVISTTLLTGQLPQTADLSEAIRVAQQGVMGQRYSSLFEQQKAYLTLANELEALKDLAEPELDTARATLAQMEEQYALLRGTQLIQSDSLEVLEQQLRQAFSAEEAARHQISIVEQQLDAARQQYETLTGIKSSIDGGVQTLSQALAQYARAAESVPRAGTSTVWSAQSYAAKNPDLLAYYAANEEHLRELGLERWLALHYQQYGQWEGRSFDVGTNRVPYDMLAMVHKDERIIPAADNRELMQRLSQPERGSQEIVAAIQRLERRLDLIEAAARSTAVSTGRTEQMIDAVTQGSPNVRVTLVGQKGPIEVTETVPA